MSVKSQGVAREGAVELARQWIGTPYHHQASAKGSARIA